MTILPKLSLTCERRAAVFLAVSGSTWYSPPPSAAAFVAGGLPAAPAFWLCGPTDALLPHSLAPPGVSITSCRFRTRRCSFGTPELRRTASNVFILQREWQPRGASQRRPVTWRNLPGFGPARRVWHGNWRRPVLLPVCNSGDARSRLFLFRFQY